MRKKGEPNVILEKTTKTPKNSLELYLASDLLTKHYTETEAERKEQASLRLFCQECSMSNNNMRKIFFRLLRLEANRVLINSVVQEQEPILQSYLDLKYRQNQTVQYQAMHLCVSISQLNNWKNRILQDVSNIVMFRLTRQDVYAQKKIINLLEVLSAFLLAKERIDPNGEVIDEYWIKAIEYRHSQYNKLLQSLNDCLAHPEKRMNRAVIARCENPHLSKEALANLCGMSSGSFSRYLHQYEQSVHDYIYD